MYIKSLAELWAITKKELSEKHLVIVCNTTETPNAADKCGSFQMNTEYFTDDEFGQIVDLFSKIDLTTNYFAYEDYLFQYILKTKPNNLLVYNAAQSGKGPGRKSLVPAFCNLHHIPCTGSNAYVVSLCRHKYHVNRLLEKEGINVPETWLYLNDWLLGRQPTLGEKVILKPIYESASIGIDTDSILIYSADSNSLIRKRSITLNQPIIAQKFIHGYEVEVPLVRVGKSVIALPAIGLSVTGNRNLGECILDYDSIYSDSYDFYDFSSENSDIANNLSMCAVDVANILGMEGLCRVDFRVELSGEFYVTDVSTNPHFVKHSSVDCAFNLLGLAPYCIPKTILSATLMKELY